MDAESDLDQWFTLELGTELFLIKIIRGRLPVGLVFVCRVFQ